MATTARELITRALYLANRVSRETQVPTEEQINDGLNLLNDLLAVKAADQGLITYFKEYDFPAVVGQEMYFVPGLIEVESLTFNIDTVRFPTNMSKRFEYFGTARVDNVQSLPVKWHVERALGGANIYLYFSPNQAFPMRVWGKFGLLNVVLDTDLELTYDRFYLTYLRYALAEFVCEEINITFQPQAERKLRSLENTLQDISPYDLSFKKLSTFQKTGTFNWGFVNFGRGWEASG